MSNSKCDGSHYESRKLTECLESQAHLCERIARSCSTELESFKYLKLAQECRAAGALEMKRIAYPPLTDFPEIHVF
jgi:hypothetical protein